MFTGNKKFEVETLPKGDAGVDRTVQRMMDLAKSASMDPRFIGFAQSISLGGGRKDSLDVLDSVLKFVRGHWTFRRDPVHMELVKTPDRLLTEFKTRGIMVGDCDDASVLVASLATALGYPARFVVLQRNSRGKFFDHIYVQALVGKDWIGLDGVALGQEPFFQSSGVRRKIYPVI